MSADVSDEIIRKVPIKEKGVYWFHNDKCRFTLRCMFRRLSDDASWYPAAVTWKPVHLTNNKNGQKTATA